MAKVSRAPKNFYTARQAAQRLGMKESTFHYHVKTGKIKKVVPPGGTEGYYPKTLIDKMAEARELFILEYAAEPITFSRASDEDIRGIHDLCVNLFGITNTASYETLLDWQRKNPETYYVVKQEGIVTGYVGFLYLNQETTQYIMSETVPGVPSPSSTDLLPFTLNEPVEGLFLGIGVRPGLPSNQRRMHGHHLIAGAIRTLEDFARRGMPVKKLYATSRTSDGIGLCRKLGFKEIEFPGDLLLRFELDLATAETPLLRKYQEIVKRKTKKMSE